MLKQGNVLEVSAFAPSYNAELLFTIRPPVNEKSLPRKSAIPAGLTDIVERSAPRALIDPPIPTKRAVPMRSLSRNGVTLYIFCALKPKGNSKRIYNKRFIIVSFYG